MRNRRSSHMAHAKLSHLPIAIELSFADVVSDPTFTPVHILLSHQIGQIHIFGHCQVTIDRTSQTVWAAIVFLGDAAWLQIVRSLVYATVVDEHDHDEWLNETSLVKTEQALVRHGIR